MKKVPFKLPESFLTQLGEFTNGYFLVTVNEEGDFENFISYPNQLTELALINYVDVQGTLFQELIRNRALDDKLPRPDEDDEAPR